MSAPVLELDRVTRRFGMTLALADMSFALHAGEVHAIVGENGAGKSTMIKIMTGIHQPTTGRILLDGTPRAISRPQAAREAGIAAIYQEPMIFPDLDLTENIFISDTSPGILMRPAVQRERARARIAQIGMRLDPDRIARGLTLAEQQAVEIARALSQDVRVLIMDEPTASLSAHEAAELRKVARTLAAQGVAVVYISHRLEEIFEIADRVTVIRDGRHISTRPVAEVTSQEMIAEMVGRAVGNYFAKSPSTATRAPVLELQDLSLDGTFGSISFDLMQGEVLCMAGLVGARRTDVALSIFGIMPPTSGTIRYKGALVAFRTPREAIRAGIAYVSEDRRKFGLAMPMPVRANVSLATLDAFVSPTGLLDVRREAAVAEGFCARLDIRTPDVETPVETLSGGNQQKVMLAKWLNLEPDLLIFDEPTRGIDIGAKAEVHDLIRAFVAAGGAAIVISSDLPEVLAMGDRILVMREGRQMGILDAEHATQERVMRLATGQGAAMEPA